MPWFVPCLLLGFIKISSHSHSVSACWMKLVEESLHDVIHDVWNSYWSAVKIIFQVFQVKGKRVARGGVPAHLWTRLSVFSFLSILHCRQQEPTSLHIGMFCDRYWKVHKLRNVPWTCQTARSLHAGSISLYILHPPPQSPTRWNHPCCYCSVLNKASSLIIRHF